MKTNCKFLFLILLFLSPSVFGQLLPKDAGKTYQNARYLKKVSVVPSTTIPVYSNGKTEWEGIIADSLKTALFPTLVAGVLPTGNSTVFRNKFVTDTTYNKYFIDASGVSTLINGDILTGSNLSSIPSVLKIGGKFRLINGTDTTEVTKVTATTFNADEIRGTSTPATFLISGSNRVNLKNAVWKNPNISVNSGETVDFTLQSLTWQPQKGNLTILDFGAKTDGTNAKSAFDKAKTYFAAGGKIIVPNGKFVVYSPIELGNNQTLEGGDSTQIFFKTAAGFSSVLWLTGNNIKVNNITFIDSSVANTHVLVLFKGGTNQEITYCKFYANKGGNSAPVHCILPTGGTDNLKIEHNYFEGFTYNFYNTNTDTFTIRNITVQYNISKFCKAEDFAFNMPMGNMSNIVFKYNEMYQNRGISPNTLMVSFANVKTGIIEGNVFDSCYLEAIHIEDRSEDIRIIGNTIKRMNLSGVSYALNILGGSIGVTKDILIENNTLDLSSNALASYAISSTRAGGTIMPSNVKIIKNTLLLGSFINGITCENYTEITGNTFKGSGTVTSGVYSGGNNIAINTDNRSNINFTKNTVIGLKNTASYLLTTSAWQGSNSVFQDNQIFDSDWGLYIAPTGANCKVLNNTFTNCVNPHKLGSTPYLPTKGNVISRFNVAVSCTNNMDFTTWFSAVSADSIRIIDENYDNSGVVRIPQTKTRSVNITSLAVGTPQSQTFNVFGALTGQRVNVYDTGGTVLSSTVVISKAFVSASNAVTIEFNRLSGTTANLTGSLVIEVK